MKQNFNKKGEKTLSYAEMLIEKYPVLELSMEFFALIAFKGLESEEVNEVAKRLNEMLEK